MQSASNCIVDDRAESVTATFDLQTGGSVDVSGQIRASDVSDPGTLSAIVAGPTGLNETDASDNAAVVKLDQSLFHEGFA